MGEIIGADGSGWTTGETGDDEWRFEVVLDGMSVVDVERSVGASEARGDM